LRLGSDMRPMVPDHPRKPRKPPGGRASEDRVAA
jgi:hypothetical protein